TRGSWSRSRSATSRGRGTRCRRAATRSPATATPSCTRSSRSRLRRLPPFRRSARGEKNVAVELTADQSTVATRRQRYGLLLLAIFASFGFQGIASPGKWQQIMITALLATTLVLALWAAAARPWVLRLSIAVAVLLVALSTVLALTGHTGGAGPR